MFTVNFWTFSKKENSTAIPAGSPTALNCNILRGSSMMAPTLELDLGTTAPAYNYCQISSFGRYYFIREWYFQGGLWTATLQVDVLATYKSQIGSASLYALRTSNSSLYDGDIVDNMYPVKTGCTYDSDTIASPWLTNNTGCYCLGIVNKDPQFGSVKYYILRPADMGNIIQYLLSDDLLTDNNFNVNDASWELQKSLIDPLQYIKSCVYMPIAYTSMQSKYTTSETVKIFNWDISPNGTPITAPVVTATDPVILQTQSFSIPKHPQTLTRGTFLNQTPYTLLTLFMPPFGLLDIDTTITANAANITTYAEIDVPSGLGILTVKCNGITVNRIEAQIGIPIQLSQVSRDYVGTATSILSGIGSIVTGVLTGGAGIVGGITGGLSGVGNAAQSIMPRSQTIGHGGSYAQLSQPPALHAQFFTAVDDDVASHGRPCCKIVNCSSGGYFLIQDADISLAGTAEESAAVRAYLENGFYYE